MPKMFYVAPDDPWTRWTNSGVSRAISMGFRRRNLLGAAMSARDRVGIGLRGRSVRMQSLLDVAGRLPGWKRRPDRRWRDERGGFIGRVLRRADPGDVVLYHYLYPAKDPRLPIRRFLLQDLTVGLGVKGGGFGFADMAIPQIEEERRRQQDAIHAADGVISFASFVRDAMASDYGYPAEKVTAMGCGPILPPPPLIELSPHRYRSKRILFVGRDWLRKGGPELLEAFRLVRARDPLAKLVLVSSRLPDLEEPGLECHRFVSDSMLRSLYSSASVFCMPSRCETWGLVYCEAARHGTPIVGFREWALPDIVVPGRTGFLAGDRTVESLAVALEEALADPVVLQRMGADAAQYVNKVLSWDAVLDRAIAAMLPGSVDARSILPLGRMPD